MSVPSGAEGDRTAGGGGFETTRWTVVLKAGRGSRDALSDLCAVYWAPIYAFFRRSRDRAEAHDLTQGFFADLLAKEQIAAADETRGRFRNWLLKAATSHRANEWRKQQAEKRGGGAPHVPIDEETAEKQHRETSERQHRALPSKDLTPEQAFDRRWALTVVERALARLQKELSAKGDGAMLVSLTQCLHRENEQTQREMAAGLGMSHSNFRTSLSRARKRLGELFKEEVRETVSTEADIEDELRFLRAVLQQ